MESWHFLNLILYPEEEIRFGIIRLGVFKYRANQRAKPSSEVKVRSVHTAFQVETLFYTDFSYSRFMLRMVIYVTNRRFVIFIDSYLIPVYIILIAVYSILKLLSNTCSSQKSLA